jgi:iron complex outermembrane recepter protein
MPVITPWVSRAGLAAGLSWAAAFGGQGAVAQEAQVTAAEDTERVEEKVVVVGRAQSLYRVTETTTGKLPTDPLLASQNIAVITSELIEDQGARDAQDLYRNISGVSVFSYAGVTARGFRQEEIFFDGLRGDPYAGFSVPQLFNVGQVEFLKGPAGMLYGAGAPGGLFNYITKKPSRELAGDASVIVGSEARYGASAELTGGLGAGGPASRLGLFYEDQNTPRRGTESTTFIADGGLGFDLGLADLVLQVTRYDQELPGNRLRGVPTDAFGNFLTDRRWNHNEPTDFLNLESTTYQARLDGDLGESVTWDAGIRYNDGTETQQYHEPLGLFPRQSTSGAFLDAEGNVVASAQDAERVMAREFRDQRRDQESLSLGVNGVWSTRLAGFDNRLLVGGDYYTEELFLIYDRARGNNVARPGFPSPIGLLDPIYGQTDPSAYVLTNPFGDRTFEATRMGAYLLNELTIDRLILTGGVRFDRFEDTTVQVFDDGRRNSGEAEDEAVTFRLGAVYRITDDISAFAQAADSFVPAGVGAFDRNGDLLSPSEGNIVEGGLKFALMDGRVQASTSLYQIVRTNIAQTDPDPAAPAGSLIAFGEVTSEGFEADIAADITPDWVITASYGYNDTRITANNGTGGITNAVGDRFANAPEHQLGFWTRYQLPAPGLAVALGGDYVDVRQSLSGQKVRPYTIFDASIIWEPEPFKLILRVDNLLDEEYASSGFIDRTGHFPGDPRSVFLEISRSF